ncbi:23S rRNA (uracil1939-C5)-methyltransferase [Catalinimonas alkaloidigena]|uniref:23S rRNA (Uracil1939-C5)-methyltransferase n=1 Tax=Catalinimonas alkaloidigena TaxID=1075417 RepID=A0A1G9PN74_9BACT|nr:23S rRNA (uracil(1939)-C(5))-methyltransferase RlmD [Catalinimonas alkaloidigena]SDL99667.1 23S rRNA (uracil1939-C5)-methyltransferase [Catalinimonas alkaloidigena]
MARKRQTLQSVEIQNVAAEGKCLTRINDKVIFVDGISTTDTNAPGVAPGDVVDLLITRDRKKFAEAVPLHFHRLSPLRVEPFCQHFGTCGGCRWQHLPYETQLQFKQQQVADQLARLGKVDLPPLQPILPSAETRFYRNKLEFTFSDEKWLTHAQVQSGDTIDDRRALGFHVPKRFDRILDIETCYLQPDPSNAIRLAVRHYARQHGLPFFNQRRLEGWLRNLIVRTTTTGEVMVILQLFSEDETARVGLLQHLQQNFPEITSLQYVINNKGNETFHDLEVKTYAGRDHLIEQMEDLRFRIGPTSFFQTNARQALELYRLTRQLAGLTGSEVVYDLYTGTGTIALFVAKQAQKVVGLEYVEGAVVDAQRNAALNGIEHAHFFAGDMKDVLTEAFLHQHGAPDVIITDPPRAGMHPDVVATIRLAAPQRIVYVSCNPATQARDVALLDDLYAVKVVQPVDMFPHTWHVENIMLLEKRS